MGGLQIVIGVYDRTVVLTFLSLVSAVFGCIVSCTGAGHPYLGGFFLLFCGLCDGLDGKVARSKKERTEREKVFGAQLDSLSDLVAFGVLPAAIAVGLLENDGVVLFPLGMEGSAPLPDSILFFVIVFFYCLAALIRLAYFNTLEAERRNSLEPSEPYFVGLPVTMSALIFPLILLLNFCVAKDLSMLYSALMVGVGFLFLVNIKIKKPSNVLVYALIGIGAIEFFAMLIILLAH